jgi:hypothetical protein
MIESFFKILLLISNRIALSTVVMKIKRTDDYNREEVDRSDCQSYKERSADQFQILVEF